MFPSRPAVLLAPLTVWAALPLAAAEPATAVGAETVADDREALTRRLEAFGEAFCNGDEAAVEAMIAPQYLHVNGAGGAYTRDQWLGWYATRAAATASGDYRCEDYELEDVSIQMGGRTAYVAATVRVRGTAEGAGFARRWRMTNLWGKSEGEWKRAGFHDVEITE